MYDSLEHVKVVGHSTYLKFGHIKLNGAYEENWLENAVRAVNVLIDLQSKNRNK